MQLHAESTDRQQSPSCARCARPLDPDDRFCGFCGHAVSACRMPKTKSRVAVVTAATLVVATLIATASLLPWRGASRADRSNQPDRRLSQSPPDEADRLRESESPPGELSLRNVARYLGPADDGRECYEWTACVIGPADGLRRIQRVRYDLYTTMLDVDSQREEGFPLTRTACDEFVLRATVFWEDGTTRELDHRLRLFASDGPALRDRAQ